jgi:hypothetical protein
MKALRSLSRGFTILEMALTLFAVGFLLSAVPQLLSRGNDALTSSPGSQPLEAAEFALKAFVYQNYRLPCPADSSVSGTENCSNSKGFVPWKTLGMARPATNSRGYPFAYGILKGSNNLGAATAKYTPTYLDSSDSYWLTPGTLTSSQVNGLDFCAKLRSQAALPVDAALLRVRDWNARTDLSKATNVAWAMVDPGITDPAFNGDNNPATSVAFESPGRAQAADYDDKVTAGTLTQMFSELHCPALLASVSAAAREADFANDNWRVRKYLLDFRSYELLVRTQKKTQSDNFLLMAALDTTMSVALGVLDLAVALAGPAGAAEIAVSAINAITAIGMSAYNLEQAIEDVITKGDEVTEGQQRVADATTAVSDAATFRTARRAALLLLDQRGWYQ